MKKTGGTLDWPGNGALSVRELRAEPGRQGGEVMDGVRGLNSPHYNYQTGLRASVGDFLPTARCGPLRPRVSAALPETKLPKLKDCGYIKNVAVLFYSPQGWADLRSASWGADSRSRGWGM